MNHRSISDSLQFIPGASVCGIRIKPGTVTEQDSTVAVDPGLLIMIGQAVAGACKRIFLGAPNIVAELSADSIFRGPLAGSRLTHELQSTIVIGTDLFADFTRIIN